MPCNGSHRTWTKTDRQSEKQDRTEQTGKKRTALDDVNLKPDRERVLPHDLKRLAVIDFSGWRLRRLWCRRRRTTAKIAWDRRQVLASRGRIRAPRRVVRVQLQRGQDIICVRGRRRRVHRDVEERGRAAALRRTERGPAAAARRLARHILLLVRAPVYARIAAATTRSLSLRPMPKESFDALRTIRLVVPSRVVGARQTLLAVLPRRGRRRARAGPAETKCQSMVQ